MTASARLDAIVERLSACALPDDVRLVLEDAAELVAAAAPRGKRNKVLTELFWVGKNGKDITREGKKRAIQDLKDRGAVHETKGGKLKLTKKGVSEFAAISKKKADLVEKGVRRFASFEEREALQASFAERASKLLAVAWAEKETARVLSTLERGDVVKVGSTKWAVFRKNDDTTAVAYKWPSKKTKIYFIRLEEDEATLGDNVVVFPVGGSGQRVGPDVAKGKLTPSSVQRGGANLDAAAYPSEPNTVVVEVYNIGDADYDEEDWIVDVGWAFVEGNSTTHSGGWTTDRYPLPKAVERLLEDEGRMSRGEAIDKAKKIVQILKNEKVPYKAQKVVSSSAVEAARVPSPKRLRQFLVDIFWRPDAERLAPESLKEPILSAYQWAKDQGLVVDASAPGFYRLTQKGLDHLSSLDEDVASAVERGMFDKKAVQAVSAADRNSAVVLTIPIPDKYAKRFPDPVMANHGHAPHLTVLFIGNKEYTPGEMSQILSSVRAACKKLPPFRLYVDPNAGLHDFGPNEEKGEKALWLPARAEPRGEVERLHRVIRMALEREGIEVGAHDSFVPHVTWAYVPNDQGPDARRRMDAHVADRFQDGFYFDVRHVMLSMPDGSTKPLALSPLPRK